MDYDNEADIASYQTYDYYLSADTGLNELDEKRVMRALDSMLTQKGLTKKVIPDFSINFYAEVFTINSRSSIGVGLGGGGGRVGGGVSGGIPIDTSKDMVAFTLEFVDALTKELFWQAVVETKLKQDQTPQERQAFMDMIIQKALEKYPPDADKKKD